MAAVNAVMTMGVQVPLWDSAFSSSASMPADFFLEPTNLHLCHLLLPRGVYCKHCSRYKAFWWPRGTSKGVWMDGGGMDDGWKMDGRWTSVWMDGQTDKQTHHYPTSPY